MSGAANKPNSGEIVTVGGGPAGLLSAVLLGAAGVPVRLFAPPVMTVLLPRVEEPAPTHRVVLRRS